MYLEREVNRMFTYYYIDNLGLKTTTDFAYNRDLAYLKSRVANGEYRELIIVKRFF